MAKAPYRSASRNVFTLVAPAITTGVSSGIFVGANRGRGQVYPDGSASNISSVRASTSGFHTLVVYEARRYGSVIGQRTMYAEDYYHLLTGQVPVQSCQLKAAVGPSALLGEVLNLGGFGQTERTVNVVAATSMVWTVSIVVLTQLCQVLLVAKKKQYERLYLYAGIVVPDR